MPVLAGQLLEGIETIVRAVGKDFPDHIRGYMIPEAGAFGRSLPPAVLAGENAGREREERKERHTMGTRGRHGVGERLRPQQVEPVLHADERPQAVVLCGARRLVDLGRSHVRAADLPDLARLDERVQCAEGLLDRNGRVGEMQLVEVDPVGTQPPQARLDGCRDPAGARAAVTGRRAVGRPELRRDHYLVTTCGQQTSEQLLGRAGTVLVSGVEEGHAVVDGRVENRCGPGLVAGGAELVTTQPDDGYLQAADSSGTHSHSFAIRL